MADFDLTQSGQEIQNILDGAAMQTDLTAETERAEQAEQQLQGNIDAEELRAKAAEEANADDIDVIEGKIPAAASSENQLADKAFVNSSITTATATYRGAYNLVSDLHLTIDATEQQIAAALAGAINTADNNDYCFVQIPTADATPTQIAAIERYKFNGTAWAYEYTLNNSGFTADQWAALNSGITTGLVAKLAALPTNDELTLLLGGKQDVLTFDNVPTEGSNNPVKSGGVKSAIDSEKERAQGAEQANAGNIAQVVAMIPAAASSENQLADKNFVNSSIATNTATYRGAYNEVSDLSLTVDATHEQIASALAGAISTADNNDYCFVQVPTADATPTQIAAIERYKFNGEAWAYEYTLNNSGFTADQWAAINSGITSGLVAKLAALPTNDDLVAALAGKQPMLTFDNVPTESSTNPVKSGGVYAAIAEEAGTRAAAIAAIVALIPSAASALNQLADKAFVNSSISTATAVFKGTFNVVADLELNYNASQAQIALMLGSKIASADNNDYCFVQIPTSNETPLEIARTDRYKYNGTAWAYEYTLNNSGFTAAQWAAINSGITSLLKDKLIDLPTATELATQLAAKQNALTFDTTPTEGSTNPVTSDGIKAAIDTEKARALAAEQGLQDDYDELYALYQTLEGGSIIPVAAADWPVSNPQQNVIYRVANSATPTAYSDYMYNGTATLLLATFTFPGIDSEPTPDSTNLVTSGGTFDAIMQNGPAFDLSAYNAVGGTLATYADLSAALTALNALPAAYKKGGMSMKFVLSSDNNYYQYRYKLEYKNTTSGNEDFVKTTNWLGVNKEITNAAGGEYNFVLIDNENKIAWGIKNGKAIWNIPIVAAGGIEGYEILNKIFFEENKEYASVTKDNNNNVVEGITKDGVKRNYVKNEFREISINDSAEIFTQIQNKEFSKVLINKYGEIIYGVRKDNSIVIYSDLILNGGLKQRNSIFTFNPTTQYEYLIKKLHTKIYNASTANVVTLVQFTDIHGDVENMQRISEFISEYEDCIDGVISCGDQVTALYSDDFSWWNDKYMLCIGNHEVWRNTTDKEDENFATELECYNKFMADRINLWGVKYSEGKNYYYKDFGSLRLIVTDALHWSHEQFQWMKDTLADALANELTVVCVGHYSSGRSEYFDYDYSCTFNALEHSESGVGYTNETITAGRVEAETLVLNFISNGGKFAMWLGGHSHCDYFGKSENGIPTIIAEAATHKRFKYDGRNYGTKSQDSFNVITFDLTNNKMYVCRIGNDVDKMMRSKKFLCYDCTEQKVLYNN